MSFILEALKKSENDRQRQSGPALFEVKVAPPRSRFAVWAAGLGALLAINLVVVGWMILRGSSARTEPASALSAPRQGPVAAPAAGAPGPSMRAASDTAAAAAAVPGTAPAPGVDTRYGVLNPTSGDGAPNAPPAGNPPGSPAVAAPGAAGGYVSVNRHAAADDSPTNADDLPAVEPPRATSVVRATESGLPTYQDAAAAPGAHLPDLRLDLHVYDAQPDKRFIFLNMMKLHEGDSMPTGVRVETITPDGVILSYEGTRFVLQHQ